MKKTGTYLPSREFSQDFICIARSCRRPMGSSNCMDRISDQNMVIRSSRKFENPNIQMRRLLNFHSANTCTARHRIKQDKEVVYLTNLKPASRCIGVLS